jgi:hypothetical protein
MPNLYLNRPYFEKVGNVDGDPGLVSWSVSPPIQFGGSLDETWGFIVGTPVVTGVFETTLTKTDYARNRYETSTLGVNVLPASSYPGPVIPAGQVFTAKVGETFNITPAINIPSNGTKLIRFSAFVKPTPNGFSYPEPFESAAAGLPPGLSVQNTIVGPAVFGNEITTRISGVPTTKGSFTTLLNAVGERNAGSTYPSDGEFKSVVFNVTDGVPIITAGQTASGKVGDAFSKTFSLTDSANR